MVHNAFFFSSFFFCILPPSVEVLVLVLPVAGLVWSVPRRALAPVPPTTSTTSSTSASEPTATVASSTATAQQKVDPYERQVGEDGLLDPPAATAATAATATVVNKWRWHARTSYLVAFLRRRGGTLALAANDLQVAAAPYRGRTPTGSRNAAACARAPRRDRGPPPPR